MRGEDRCHFDSSQPFERSLSINARLAHTAQGTADGTRLRRMCGGKLGGAAAALAMIGLREIYQLEVDGKRLGDTIGFNQSHATEDERDAFHQHRCTCDLLRPLCAML